MINANYVNCDTTQQGTGILDCAVEAGVPIGVITVPKTWELTLSSDTFDTAYIKGRIKAKEFTPFLDAIDYEDVSEERGDITTSTKVKIKTVNGKPGFELHFSKGLHFHKATYSRNSFNAINSIICYDNGVVSVAYTDSTSTKIKGHETGLFDTKNFMHPKGDDPQKTVLEFQLTNPVEYNQRMALLEPGANSFNLDLIDGIVDVSIEKVQNTPNTTVRIKITADENSARGIKGVASSNISASGTSETISSMSAVTSEGDGVYDVVFSADVSSDYSAMTFKMYDSSDSTNVAEVSGVLYEGST